MNLQKRELKWLLLMLLPIIIIPATMQWQLNKTSRYGVATFPNDAKGERHSLGTLSYYLEKDPTNNVAVFYMTPEDDDKWHEQVKLGTRVGKTWVYFLNYNRYQNVLTKTLYTEMPIDETPIDNSKPTRIWRWENVDVAAIHQVAAPMRKLYGLESYTGQKKYNGGNLSELQKYGARLKTE